MDSSTVVSFAAAAAAPAAAPTANAATMRSHGECEAAVASSGEQELVRLRARVRELSTELIRAQEAACRHVARELHDSVGAELTATRFALAGVETWLPADAPAQCVSALAVANRSLDAVCTATREAVAELHAPSLDAGIVHALAQWTRDFASRTQLRTSFVCPADVRLTRLPADAALAVFRVAQEALNNIAKHARAESADVRIETSRRHLTVVISDDGIGVARNAHRRQGHFGLSGMKARCAAFDGTLRVTSRRGPNEHGTRVCARFAWDAIFSNSQAAGQRAVQS